MSFTESTPVTIHTHSDPSSTVTYNATVPPYDSINTLSPDQFGDAVLGTAVLAGGNEVVISASIANNVNYNGFATYPGYPHVYETIIDNGVATTQMLALTGGSDFLNAPDGEDLLKVVPLTGGDFVVVEEARTSANPNLYFELFNSSGTFLSGGQVNPSGNASELNDSFNLTPTSTNGFVVEWNEGNNQTGHFETFNVSGSTATGLGDKQFNDGTNNGTNGFIGNVAVATNGNVIVATNPVGAGAFVSSNFAIYTASGATVVGPESFATAEGSLLPNENNGSGNPLENAEVSPRFVALPGGGFLAVIANPTAPYNSSNFVPGFNMYLQTISATGVFGTPELVETTTNGAADNTLNPIVLSNGHVVIDIGGHYNSQNVFVPGTYEVVDPTKTPANISTLMAMTPLFPSAVAPTLQTVSPIGADSPLQVVIPNSASANGGPTNTFISADNSGGVFAALQSGIYTGFFGYGTLDANLYAADFDPSPPTVTAGSTATFTGGGSAVVLDAGLTVNDATSSTLASATVTIGGFITGDTLAVGNLGGLSTSFSAGVLTLTGTASLATYQTALDSISYSFTAGGDPTGGGSHTSRTIDWVVNDGTLSSATVTSTLNTVHVAPTIIAGGTANFGFHDAPVQLDSVTVNDVDSGNNLSSATISIGAGYVSGEDTLSFTSADGITGNFSSGVLNLSGSATLADYQTVLGSVTFDTTSTTAGSRTIDWIIGDGVLNSAVAESTVDVAPCYCPGTLIRTKRGQKPVEKLEIGDKVMTVSGVLRPIKWIGRRSYGGRFVMGRKDILPVCIKAGALGENLPRRDLWISPHHAMYLEGVLIEARDLVNGASIVQAERVDKVEYFHIELDSHDVIIAEGAPSESFVDDDSRGMFHNAHEYGVLYPDAAQGATLYCAPRLGSGYEVEAARRHIDARAGLRGAVETQPQTLRGHVDVVTPHLIAGWAQNIEHPEAPVCLDIFADDRLIGRTLANRYRDDLANAGLGSGNHCFEFKAQTNIRFEPRSIEVRRSLDGSILDLSGATRRAG
jgi:hypothetical protein